MGVYKFGKESQVFTVTMQYHRHSDHYFVTFSNESGNVVSIKMAGEAQARAVARDLEVLIME